MFFIARLATRASAFLQGSAPRTPLNSCNYSKKAKSKTKRKRKVRVDRGPFGSELDYKSRLRFDSPSLAHPLSGIICTIGPASNKIDILVRLIEAGMRVVRLNFSHGSYEYHCNTIHAAREAIKEYAKEKGAYKPIAIALDTKGPEIRTGLISGSGTAEIELSKGDSITLSTDKSIESNGTREKIYVDYEKLGEIVKKGDMVYIDDGLISLKVKEASKGEVKLKVVNGGMLGSRKGVNLPGIPVDLPSISEKDKEDLEFGVENKVDMIFASFIREANAISEIRKVLGPKGKNIKIISKIENQQGMDNIDDIIDASDGIMVARGDLGIEIHTEDVVLAQKCIIAKCNMVGKPVICATQMLESMNAKPRPTRAEASDVANAIFDGADCVMLSGETAKGKYPVVSVEVMANICRKMERTLWYERIQNDVKSHARSTTSDNLFAITSGITEIATIGRAAAIFLVSPCALIAQMISQFRPSCPIVYVTGSHAEARQLVIFRGIYPLYSTDMAHGCQDFNRILLLGMDQMTSLDIVRTDKPVSILVINALNAGRITFRLVYTILKSRSQRCKDAIEKQAKLLQAQAKKKQKRNSLEKATETPKSKQLIEKCKKLAEKQKCDNTDKD